MRRVRVGRGRLWLGLVDTVSFPSGRFVFFRFLFFMIVLFRLHAPFIFLLLGGFVFFIFDLRYIDNTVGIWYALALYGSWDFLLFCTICVVDAESFPRAFLFGIFLVPVSSHMARFAFGGCFVVYGVGWMKGGILIQYWPIFSG